MTLRNYSDFKFSLGRFENAYSCLLRAFEGLDPPMGNSINITPKGNSFRRKVIWHNDWLHILYGQKFKMAEATKLNCTSVHYTAEWRLTSTYQIWFSASVSFYQWIWRYINFYLYLYCICMVQLSLTIPETSGCLDIYGNSTSDLLCVYAGQEWILFGDPY